MLVPWKKSNDKPRQHIKKQRHHFANKGPYSQSYGFSSSHVKESLALKHWCFGTVVLEKTLESPFDSKEIKPVNSKGNQSWIFFGRTDGFPGSSAGKESTCNAGDTGSIPGLGSSPGEGIGYPPQYSSAPLVAQTVKNLPAMQETWFWSLGWEDPLEKGMVTHTSVLVSRITVDRGAWRTIVYGVPKSQTQLSD